MYFLLEATEIHTGVPEYSSVDNLHLSEKAFFTLLLSPIPPLMGATLTSLEDIPTNTHLSGLKDVSHAPPFQHTPVPKISAEHGFNDPLTNLFFISPL